MVTFAKPLEINICRIADFFKHYLKNNIFVKHCFNVSHKVESAHAMYELSKLILGDVFLIQQTLQTIA